MGFWPCRLERPHSPSSRTSCGAGSGPLVSRAAIRSDNSRAHNPPGEETDSITGASSCSWERRISLEGIPRGQGQIAFPENGLPIRRQILLAICRTEVPVYRTSSQYQSNRNGFFADCRGGRFFSAFWFHKTILYRKMPPLSTWIALVWKSGGFGTAMRLFRLR